MPQKWLLLVMACAVVTAVATGVAVFAAARSFKLISALSRITKDSRNLSVALDEVRDTITILADRYENLRARVGMRETRAARGNGKTELEDLPTGEWKAEMRKRLAEARTNRGSA